MNKEAFREEVRRLAVAVLQVPAPENGDLLRDQTPAWDSLKHVDLMFAIEDEFSVRFSQDQFASLGSLEAIVDSVEQLLVDNPPAAGIPAPLDAEGAAPVAPPVESLTFHHVGCAVKDLEKAIEIYRPVARSIGEIVFVASQEVRLCFAEVGPQVHVELIEPAGVQSPVHQLLATQISFYHVGFLAAHFERALAQLGSQRYQHLNTFRSEAFGMRRCAFLSSPVSHLIEIIEQG